MQLRLSQLGIQDLKLKMTEDDGEDDYTIEIDKCIQLGLCH